MSDFVFCAETRGAAELSAAFKVISPSAAQGARYFSGEWGALTVGRTPYRGYEPYEDDQYICVVLGGPVLYFRDNSFLSGGQDGEGTRAILQRWREHISWDEDLSGPFVVLIIDKKRHQLMLATDLMLFIPVFVYGWGKEFCLSSHVGMLAAVSGQAHIFDPASLADFVLNGYVTFPFTAYTAIRQAEPASEHHWSRDEGWKSEPYWQPAEALKFSDIEEAARYLRQGFKSYIERVTSSMDHVAQFISGGEDSRVLSGALPERLQRDAYIFLDGMNREGKIAESIAQAYGADFRPDYRSPTHYLDILPEAAALVGGGFQYRHAHILGFHERHRLYEYPAVFGGYYSDTLLKALCVRLTPLSDRFDFLPQRVLSDEARAQEMSHPLFSAEVMSEVNARSQAHVEWVCKLRSSDRHEWSALWPSTMRPSITNLHFNRRLCASFEPFLCKEAVKICAAVPVEWKLNRRIFLRAFRPFLRKTVLHRHADGRFPYFPWWFNNPIRFTSWLFRAIAWRVTGDTTNQGPWCNWDSLVRSSAYTAALADLKNHCQNGDVTQLLRTCLDHPDKLTPVQKVNLMQICHLIVSADGDLSHRDSIPMVPQSALEVSA